MVGPDIKYNKHHQRLSKVLSSIERSGDYFAEGRLTVPPPLMGVDQVGTIAFPVLPFQLESLIQAAERAPYGRGTETILDRSVRDCWQIDASHVQFRGERWDQTLTLILERVEEQLGLPKHGVSARPYKLLVYETGGFFSSHRDTEKVDGMIATLVISLPSAGRGGELVVRHKDREAVIDLCVEEPGELAFAAFYADCSHETKPVRTGNRVSLIYNLVVEPGSRAIPAASPDSSGQAREAASILGAWADSEDGPRKLVWILEHDYSEAGLGVESLKGIDASVARTLGWAAETSGCALHLAILCIDELGIPDYDFVYGQWDFEADDDTPMEEVHDGSYTLKGWFDCRAAGNTDLPPIPLQDGEALPAGALDNVPPDEQSLTEATGNEGVSLERSYRRAALVIWPTSRTVPAVAQGQIGGAVDYVARTLRSADPLAARGSLGSGLAAQLIDAWPAASRYYSPRYFMTEKGSAILGMLRILSDVADRQQTARFLEAVVIDQYHGDLNEPLADAIESIGPVALRSFLPQFVDNNVKESIGGVVNLLLRLDRADRKAGDGAQRDVLRAGARAAFEALPAILEDSPSNPARNSTRKSRALDADAVRDLFLAAEKFELRDEADQASDLIARRLRQVDPYCDLPRALHQLRRKTTPALGSTALVSLWQFSSMRLLARSGTPPPGPEDKSIDASLACCCRHCRRIAAFCRDRDAAVLRYPVRQQVRRHLRHKIGNARLDLECVTERRGSPYTLVCRKTPAGYQKRVKRYAGDIAAMRLLVRATPEVHSPKVRQTAATLERAISRAA